MRSAENCGDMAYLKVSSRSNPNAVAGAFAGVVRERGRAEVQVVGAGALNQAIKAVAIARTLLATQGVDLVCAPSFTEIEINGEPRTAMHLIVEDRGNADPAVQMGAQLGGSLDLPDLRLETVAQPVAPVEASPSI